MKSLKLLSFIFLYLILSLGLTAQTYFSEDFETGGLPSGWANVYVVSNINWEYQNGGFTKTPQYPYTRKPYPAHGGSYNALFQKESFAGQTTKLVTKPINLSLATRPELTFWHAQAERYFFGSYNNDELRVYYKKTSTSPWVKIAEYTTKVELWTQRSILLPDTALTGTFYIAFEGKSKAGWGVCVDDVAIIETQSIPKSVDGIEAKMASTQFIATTSQLNPILRLTVKIKGNVGIKTLESVTFQSLNTTDADIKSSGVRLYRSSDSTFTNYTQIGIAKNFSSGSVSYTGIGYSLPSGYTYLWLTYDISATATVGDTVDAKINANSISISGSTYPATELSPPGIRQVYQSIFSDGFETNLGWTLTGDFTRGKPTGQGGLHYGNPDPTFAFADSTVLGTVLASPGDYPPNLTDRAYSALSPVINCKYYKNVHLQFMRWLNIDISDHAYIDIIADGLDTCIWQSSGFITEKQWTQVEYDISDIADRHTSVQIRISLGSTNISWEFSGWNIDNLIVSGDYITKDVGITGWVTPVSNCGLTSTESVSVYVKNFAPVNSPASIPLYYTFNNGTTKVNETLNQTLSSGQTVQYTFTTKVDLSTPDIYSSVYAQSDLTGDEDSRNDKVSTTIFAFPTYTLPSFEDFEGTKEYWKSGGTNSSWTRGFPTGDSMKMGFTSLNTWFSNRLEFMQDNENSYLESPCYTISDTSKVIVEFKFFSQLLQNEDGIALYYTVDNGTTWNIIPRHSYSWDWNWYNSNNVAVLGTPGWDYSSTGWITAKQVLPEEIENQSNVKFRFVSQSGTYDYYEGFAFDDFKVYEAPTNITLEAITSHVDACQHVNPSKISFRIRNNGIRALIKTKDKIVAGFKINNGITIIDTLTLSSSVVAIGQTEILTFNKTAGIENAGSYNIKVFDIDPNQGYYAPVADVDTVEENIIIYPNPVTGLPDSIASAQLDTVRIQAIDSSLYDYTWKIASNSNLATTSYLDHPFPGKVWLTIENNNAEHCSTTDTVFVNKLVPDIGVKSILSPSTSCELGNAVYFHLSIKNYGTDTLRSGDTITTAIKIDNGSAVLSGFRLSSMFKPGDTINFTYPTHPQDMSAIDTFQLQAYTRYAYDSIPTNDTIHKQVSVWGYPTVNIGPDDTVAGYYDIHAGPGYTTYRWDDNITADDSIYRVTSIGNHWVMVTDEHNCPAYDTAYIHVVIHDIKPAGIVEPVTACGNGSAVHIKLNVVNFGTDTITSGEHIHFSYALNGGSWINFDSTLTSDLHPSDTIMHVFSTTQNFAAVDTYQLKVATVMAGDINTSNDTSEISIATYGYPAVNIGPDTIVKALLYTLDAGTPPDAFYFWSNGSTSRTITITSSGSPSVILTNTQTGCQSFDTAVVTLEIKDGSLTKITSVSGACQGSFNSTSVEFTNAGNYSLPSGDTIFFYYVLNGASPVAETYKLAADLTVGGKVTHTFSNLKNKVVVGQNQFVYYTMIRNELRHNNDTIKKTVEIWPVPTVNLGGDEFDTIRTNPPYVLEAPFSSDYAYDWQDHTHDSIFTVTTSGLYYVTVENVPTGCTDRDTVYVKIVIPDGGIIDALASNQACKGHIGPVQATFKNLGNIIIPAGEDILFVYELNSSVTKSDVVTLSSTLLPGATLSHTFNNVDSFAIVGTNHIKIYSIISNDIDPSNDTVYLETEVIDKPALDLSPYGDTITDYPPFTLDPGLGSGYDYLWQDGSTGSTFTFDTSAMCRLTITDQVTLCSNTDSVYINIQIPDGSITNAVLASSACYNTVDQMTAEFTNTGNIDILAGEIVRFVYKVGNSAPVYSDTTLAANQAPGSKITRTLSGLGSRLTVGLNTVKVYPVLPIDIVSGNDTLVKTITIYALPVPTITGSANVCTNQTGMTYSTEGSMTGYTWNISGGTIISGNTTNSITVDWGVPGSGSLSVNYINGNSCTAETPTSKSITINALPVPSINGPLSVCANSVEIYKTEKAMTNYSWSVTGGTQTAGGSATDSTITIEWGAAGSGQVSVNYTNSNGCSAVTATSSNVTINVRPVPTLSGTVSICENSTGSVYKTEKVKSNYAWTVTGGTIAGFGSATDSTVTVDWGSSGTGQVSVNYANSFGCSALNATVAGITINPLPVPVITGLSSVCTNDAGELYKTEKGMSSYNWSFSGGTLASNGGSTDSTITINWGGAGTGNVSVSYTNGNGCTAATATNKSITIHTRPVPTIVGNNNVCGYYTGNIYKSEKGMNSYSWSITGGTIADGGTSTDSIVTVTWGAPGSGQVLVNYANANNCSASAQTSLGVTLKASPLVALGSDTISVLPDHVLKMANNPNTIYLWQDGSTADSMIVDITGKYYVLATNTITGCNNTDTVYAYVSLYDGSITKVTGPADTCEGLFSSIEAEFTNTGAEILNTGDFIKFAYKLNGMSAVEESVQLTEDMTPGSKLNHTFTGLSGKVNPGSNIFKVYSIINYDIDNSNDTLQYNLTLNPLPAVNIASGKDTLTSYPGKVLSSKLGTGYSYQWQNGSTADSIVADTSGLYKLSVVNLATGCIKADSVVMIIEVPDISILPLTGNTQLCEGSSLLVELGAFNSGDVTYKAGDIFRFGYTINGLYQHIDSVSLTSDMSPGDTVSHQLADFSSQLMPGANNITFFVKPTIDVVQSNDSLDEIFTVHLLPVISFESGKDTLYVKAPYQLIAGPSTGYTYLWQDNSTLSSFNVLGTGKYYARKIDVNGCFASDTIMIYAVNPDATISSIQGNPSACFGQYDTLHVELTNEGLLAFPANDTILYSLLVNNSLVRVDTVVLSDSLEPAKSVSYTFTDIDAFFSAGTDVIKVSCTLDGDENYNNDTSAKTVVINPLPPLNLNNEVYAMTLEPPYVLDAGLGSNYTYTWQDGSQNQTIPVASDGKYKVTATNIASGCSSGDSVLVTRAFVDVAVTSVLPVNATCKSDFQSLIIELTNIGDIILASPDSVDIYVVINNGTARSTRFGFASQLITDQSVLFTFVNLPSGIITGTNTIKVSCQVLYDNDKTNDTLKYNLTINSNPVLNIAGGKDTVEYSGTYTLDAGAGFSSYLWNTKATSRTITVNSQAWFVVIVSNAQSCKSKDSVFMKIITKINELPVNKEFLVFPNPAKTIINLKIENSLLVDPVLEIFSSDLKSVYHQTVKTENNILYHSIHVEGWKKGIYYIRVYDRQLNKQLTQKVVIE